MSNITTFPDEELAADLLETEQDITICQKALAVGITHYCNGTESVQRRLNVNLRIKSAILAEQIRRKQAELDALEASRAA